MNRYAQMYVPPWFYRVSSVRPLRPWHRVVLVFRQLPPSQAQVGLTLRGHTPRQPWGTAAVAMVDVENLGGVAPNKYYRIGIILEFHSSLKIELNH